jgi:hypothetical protein
MLARSIVNGPHQSYAARQKRESWQFPLMMRASTDSDRPAGAKAMGNKLIAITRELKDDVCVTLSRMVLSNTPNNNAVIGTANPIINRTLKRDAAPVAAMAVASPISIAILKFSKFRRNANEPSNMRSKSSRRCSTIGFETVKRRACKKPEKDVA